MSNYFKTMMDSPLKSKPEVISFAITNASTSKDKYTVTRFPILILLLAIYIGDEDLINDMGSIEKI
jgi:hypothetical protein